MKKKFMKFMSYLPLVVVILTPIVVWIISKNVDPEAVIPKHLRPLVIMGFVIVAMGVLSGLVQTIGYMVHALRNKNISSRKGTVWAVAIYFLNILVFPIYCQKHIINCNAEDVEALLK